MQKYFYEVYLKGPNGEPGYEIKTGTLHSGNLQSAILLVNKKFDNLDCIIDLYPVSKDFVI